MKKTASLVLASVLLSLPPTLASETSLGDEPSKTERSRSTFRIDYSLYEVEGGKRVNERMLSMTVNEGHSGQLRAGTRVPITMGDKGIVYQDVGVKISGRVLERDGDLTLDTEIELSQVATADQPAEPRGNPVLRTVSQSLSTRPVLGKPAVVSTLDDVATRKRLQAEVTVTRLPGK